MPTTDELTPEQAGYLVEAFGAPDLLPSAPVTAWAEGDMPRGESLDLEEYPATLLKLRKCRSFRADLRHKLEIIIRAHGGWGEGGQRRAGEALRVHRHTIRAWYLWIQVPAGRLVFERIDNVYGAALETLALEASKKLRRVR